MRIATKVLATAVLIAGTLGGTWYGLGLSGSPPVGHCRAGTA